MRGAYLLNTVAETIAEKLARLERENIEIRASVKKKETEMLAAESPEEKLARLEYEKKVLRLGIESRQKILDELAEKRATKSRKAKR